MKGTEWIHIENTKQPNEDLLSKSREAPTDQLNSNDSKSKRKQKKKADRQFVGQQTIEKFVQQEKDGKTPNKTKSVTVNRSPSTPAALIHDGNKKRRNNADD